MSKRFHLLNSILGAFSLKKDHSQDALKAREAAAAELKLTLLNDRRRDKFNAAVRLAKETKSKALKQGLCEYAVTPIEND